MRTKRLLWLLVPIVLISMMALAQTEGTRANIVEKSGNTIVLDIGSDAGVTAGMEGYFWTKTRSGDRDYHMIVARFRVARVEAQRCWVTAEAVNEGYTAKDFQWATFAVNLVPAIAPGVESAPARAGKEQSEKAPVGVPAGKSLEWYVEQANALFVQGNYTRAKEFYLMVMKLDPQDTVAMDKYAQCQRKMEAGELEKKYRSYLERGDKSLSGSDAAGALAYYLLALQTLPAKEAEVAEKFKKTAQQAPQEWAGFSTQHSTELGSILFKYFPESIDDLIKMVLIPSGEFQMGSKNGSENEKPIHRVLISAFFMGKTEVTQGLWKMVMGSNPSKFKDGDDYPVENVSWDDAQKFLQRLNEMTGRKYRLPTEAEWEYACRAGTTGDSYGDLNSVAWYSDNAGGRTSPIGQKLANPWGTHLVGQKKANSWGLYDMLGNVWEWCQDWYGSYGGGNQTDPSGPPSGEKRVGRGGAWNRFSRSVRSANRGYDNPSIRNDDTGFRLARTK